MEERIIDDEYGRGIRLKKTKEGYVDVTDELAEETEEVTEPAEEMAFEFPVLDTDEDDEDLVGLSPEEALKLRQKKEAEAKERRVEYEKECKDGEELLNNGDFKGAEAKFEKALNLDAIATEASVGYWRAKTENFANPDTLVGEYADASIESLEYDLGMDAVDILKRDYKEVFQKRYDELSREEAPLAEKVEAAQARRREIISARLKRSTLVFLAVALPMAALLALAVVFALKIFTPNGDDYIVLTIVFGAAFFLFFLAFIVATNKLINNVRIKRANERLDATEEGERLVEIRDYKTIYACLLDISEN
ncbi:MAG: hypothetical protein IJ329_01475 [Clostridia bacterium]|nr:hypothetical protein [Clostridia bacterium]